MAKPGNIVSENNHLPKFFRDTESLSGFKRRIFKNILNS